MLPRRCAGCLIFLLLGMMAGCQQLFPYQKGRVEQGVAASDLNLVDAGAAEHPLCVEEQAVPLLQRSCTGSCGDGALECDGIDNYRDPSPSCNRLLFEETFTKDYAQTWTTYSTLTESWRWSCGRAEQTLGGDAVSWLVADQPASGLASPDYMVEARIELGEIKNPDKWGVGIAARVGPGLTAFLVCELARDLGTPLAYRLDNPDTRIWLTADGLHPSGWPPDNDGVGPTDPGTVFFLQLFYTPDINRYVRSPVPACQGNCPAVVCRACNQQACRTGFFAIYVDPTTDAQLPREPGTVGIRSYGRNASFDWLRVFELQNP